MAAYAAVVSLMNTIHNIRIHPRVSTFVDQKQIESLSEKLDFLLGFIESDDSHGGMRKEEVEKLESQIASAAYAVEDAIESHVADQILAGCGEEGSTSLLDLKKEIEELDSVMGTVMEAKEERRFKVEQLVCSEPANSSRPLTYGETPMVGFDDHLVQLVDLLIGGQPDQQIIPIVGIGGIGKTTLARNAFDNVVIMQHFNARAWVTVLLEYNLRQILLDILVCLGNPTSELVGKTQDVLGERLYKSLFGRRYLIVLDDVWSEEFWDMIKGFFPDNYNGSRIVVTTRLSNLASYLGSSRLRMNFLDEDQSWTLFCNKAFAGKGCPPELEGVGKTLVRQCKGLPLSIVVIAGLLQKSSMTLEFWENIATDISSILSSMDDNSLLHILSLSYSHLPTHLKPCFLYMGVFPEDNEIRVSQLIKLWVAEGFIKPSSHKSLEGVAMDYLLDLIDRNLVLVCSLGSNGKLYTCGMHDLLKELCIRIGMKEKFLCVVREFGTPQDKNYERRIIIRASSVENPQLLHTLESSPLARTVICDSPATISFKSRLLRVLVEVYGDSLDDTFQQVNLRFLAYKSVSAPVGWIRTYELPSSISLLWNVQTLIMDENIDKVVAPSEIWEMPQLRHIQFHRISLPDPPMSNDQDGIVLHNLQTLRTVLDFRCSEEVCRRVPNIEKLRIFYDDFSGEDETSSGYGLYNVGNFKQLESLYCCFYALPVRDDLLKNLNFPCSLKKLRLEDCELHWRDLSIIGSLPLLEVLKLKHQSVRGPKWNTVEGHFLRLKFLEIDSCYLIHWIADGESFPRLETLVLSRLYKLSEIPSGMGDIPTLQSIRVVDCSISAAISAVRMLEEQESLGNEDLKVRVSFTGKMKLEEEEEKSPRNDDRQVQVGFSEKMKLEEFRERVELQGFKSNNLHIDGV